MASVGQLSDEVMVAVLRWLPAVDLAKARQVCHDWRRVADDDLLWRSLATSRWQSLPEDEAWAVQLGESHGWRGRYIFKQRFDHYWDHQVSFKWRLVDDPLHIPQTDQCALGVIDSYVYVFGGRLADTTSRDLWIYSVSKKNKKVKGVVLKRGVSSNRIMEQWPPGRINSNGAVIDDRYFYIVAGSRDGGSLLNDVWVFDSVTQKWSEVETTGALPARWTHSVTAVGKRLFVFGGWSEDSNFNDLCILDTETREWSVGDMTGDIPPPIGCHTASLVGRYIFIYGGDDVGQRMYSDIYRLDTETLVIEKLTINGELQPERRESHDAVVVGNHILYYGGQCAASDDGDIAYPTEARRRGAGVVVFNTDALTWHHPRIKGEPIGLNWHKLSFVNNALQVWFGATKELHERGEKRSIGILTLKPELNLAEAKADHHAHLHGKCNLQ